MRIDNFNLNLNKAIKFLGNSSKRILNFKEEKYINEAFSSLPLRELGYLNEQSQIMDLLNKGQIKVDSFLIKNGDLGNLKFEGGKNVIYLNPNLFNEESVKQAPSNTLLGKRQIFERAVQIVSVLIHENCHLNQGLIIKVKANITGNFKKLENPAWNEEINFLLKLKKKYQKQASQKQLEINYLKERTETRYKEAQGYDYL
ncbi:MAG: hypothetical protein HYU63_03485 [Armatimonadetes bacterium]|nr:hypothetical protein [Armatimonadota bacterium]